MLYGMMKHPCSLLPQIQSHQKEGVGSDVTHTVDRGVESLRIIYILTFTIDMHFLPSMNYSEGWYGLAGLVVYFEVTFCKIYTADSYTIIIIIII